MRTVAKIGLASALLLGTAHVAFAGVIGQTLYDPSSSGFTATTFGIQPGTGVAGTSPGTPTDPLTFAGFDATYDATYGAGAHTGVTLDSVQITVQETAQVSGVIKNTGTGPETLTVGVDNWGSFSLSGAVASAMSQLNVEDHKNFSFSNIAVGDTETTGLLTTTPVSSSSGAITSDLALFANSFGGLDGDLGFSSTGCGNGNCNGSSTDAGQIAVSVAYTYSANPPPSVMEPTSMAILASGLLGVGMIRRRRRG